MVFANIGDAHAMGQKPITFIRQVRKIEIEILTALMINELSRQ